MKQVDVKEALMQSAEFNQAYMELKELIRNDKYWFLDSLEYYPDIVPVNLFPEYKVKYGNLWMVYAEIMFPENYPRAKPYGFVFVESEQ